MSRKNGGLTEAEFDNAMGSELRSTNSLETVVKAQADMITKLLASVSDMMTTITSTKPTHSVQYAPDLVRNIKMFDADKSLNGAIDWLESIKLTAKLFAWDDQVKLTTARAHMEGAALHWFTTHQSNIQVWTDFEYYFRNTFTALQTTSDKWNSMRKRIHNEKESVIQYFLEKQKLCKRLNLTIQETRDEIIRGLCFYEYKTAMCVKNYLEEEDILRDLIALERNRIQRKPVHFNKRDPEKANFKEIVCYICHQKGHQSFTCPRKDQISSTIETSTENKRSMRCFKCKKEGQLKHDCPELKIKDSVNFTKINRDSGIILKWVYINNGIKLKAMIDNGSAVCTIKSDIAAYYGLKLFEGQNKLYAFGDTNKPAMECTKYAVVTIKINEARVDKVRLWLVPNGAQDTDMIVGRSFSEQEGISYYRTGDRLNFIMATENPLDHIKMDIEHHRENVVVNKDTIVNTGMNDIEIKFYNNHYVIPVDNQTGTHTILQAGDIIGKVDYVTEAVETESSEICLLTDTEAREKREEITSDMLNVGSSITMEQQLLLLQLLRNYRQCFALKLDELGCTDLVKVSIKDNDIPISCKPYKTSRANREETKEILKEWRRVGLVTNSNGAYTAPVLLVSKKTGFITEDERGKFERLTFGLRNAPFEFQKVINIALSELRNKVLVNYLDDILIPATDFNDMCERLQNVLEALKVAKLTLKITKCEFGKDEIDYLEFVITKDGIKPGKRKVSAIAHYPAPTNCHEVKRFLGLTGYFRRFVGEYAIHARPLTELTRSNMKFEWGPEQKKSFQYLKDQLISDRALKLFNQKDYTELHTDASNQGLAGFLMQRDDTGKMKLVYCVSKKTTDAESKYHSSRLEMYAIVWCVEWLRMFLLNIDFVIVTDCECLIHINEQKVRNPQFARWMSTLSEYSYKIIHRPGKEMCHVDALSRAPQEEAKDKTDFLIDQRLSAHIFVCIEDERIDIIQGSDEKLRSIIKALGEKERTKEKDHLIKNYVLQNGRLYRQVKVQKKEKRLFVMPDSTRKSLCVRNHDLTGHPGVEVTVHKISENYWFRSMRKYVKNHIGACIECPYMKVPAGRKAGFLNPICPPTRPFERGHADHLGPLPMTRNGNTHILIIMDALTRYVRLYHVPDTKCATTVCCVQQFVCDYGLPKLIVTDRGTAFIGNEMRQFVKETAIHHTVNSARHPQANGIVERVNRRILPMLAASTKEQQWDVVLKKLERDINNTVNRTTGQPPFECLYGFAPNTFDGKLKEIAGKDPEWRPPAVVQNEARENIKRNQVRQKSLFDKRGFKGVNYNVGDIEVVKSAKEATGESTKLQARYTGPMIIVEVLPSDTYRLRKLNRQTRGRKSTAHVAQLKIYKYQTDSRDDDSGNEEDDELEDEKSELDFGKTYEPETHIEVATAEDETTSHLNEKPKRKTKEPAYLRDYLQ